MRKAAILIFLFLLFLVMPNRLLSSPNDLTETALMSNGRGWNDWSETAKVFYVAAYRDTLIYLAIGLPGAADDTVKHFDAHWAKNAIVGDYVKELDVLYKDGENVRLPIPVAIRYCTMKLEGELPKNVLDSMLITLRKIISDIEP